LAESNTVAAGEAELTQ